MNKTNKLKNLARIAISNVDKKTKAGEPEVRLCNFVDVYHNWAITSAKSEAFMIASANKNQISSFTVRKGQVAITKDSETRDDIGIPTYIADDLNNVVLGYHCALITPNPEELDGAYLNVVLHSMYAQKYFEANASGSGQRYTLTDDIIGDFPVPLPDLRLQKRIAKLFADIDRKIENNMAIVNDLAALIEKTYDYWFVQYDFPNKEGHPYKSNGGDMVWNSDLKQKIPDGWSKRSLSSLAKIVTTSVTPEGKKLYQHYSIPAFDKKGLPALEHGDEINSNKYAVPKQSILVSKLNPQFKRIWYINDPGENAICSTEFMPFISLESNIAYLFATLNSQAFYTYMVQCSSSSTGSRKRMEPDLCMVYGVSYPNDESLIHQFNDEMLPLLNMIQSAKEENSKLESLRNYLLPLIINGQISI